MSAARLPTRQAVDIRSHRKPSATTRRQELELKLTDLQQHYAELRSEIARPKHPRLGALGARLRRRQPNDRAIDRDEERADRFVER